MAKEKISVVGAGVVGQATGRGFIEHGYPVQFIDVKEDVLSKLRQSGQEAFNPQEAAENDDSDVTIFTVSTPTNDGEINLKYLEQAVADFGKRLAKQDKYHLVVMRSTISPGTTERLTKVIEEASGKKAGEDFGVCMNPEYLREVSAEADFKNPWIITIGQLDERSGDLLDKLYAGYTCPKNRVSILEAEVQKYVHNLYNAAKISYFNEMRDLCEKLKIDADKIFPIVAKSCEGMWNPEYGIKNYGPFDGMCLPKDTQALYAWAKEKGWELTHLKATIDVNNELVTKLAAQKEAEKETVDAQMDPVEATA